jgi:hypothetical protein
VVLLCRVLVNCIIRTWNACAISFPPPPTPCCCFRVVGPKLTQTERHSAFRLRLVFILNLVWLVRRNSIWRKTGLRAWVLDAAATTVNNGLFVCFLTLRLLVLIHGRRRVCGKPEWGIILFQVKQGQARFS